MRTPCDFMPWSCKMANRIMQRLLTVYSNCTHLQPREPRLSMRNGDLSSFRVFLSGPGCVCWPYEDLSGLRGIVGDKGKQLWGFQDGEAGRREKKSGRLPGLGTHRALSEARACTQHRCWEKLGEGIHKKGWGRPVKKRRHAETVQTILNLVFVLDRKLHAIVKSSGKNSQKSYPI